MRTTSYQDHAVKVIIDALIEAGMYLPIPNNQYRPDQRRFIANGIIRCAFSFNFNHNSDRLSMDITKLQQMVNVIRGLDLSTSHIRTKFHDDYREKVYCNIGPYPDSERIELSSQVLAVNDHIVRRLLSDFRKHPLSQKVQDTSLLPVLGDALEDAGCSHNLLLALCRQASPSALYLIRNQWRSFTSS